MYYPLIRELVDAGQVAGYVVLYSQECVLLVQVALYLGNVVPVLLAQ